MAWNIVYGQIGPGPLTVYTGGALPPGVQGQPYSQQLSAAGGTPPYVSWKLAAGKLNPWNGTPLGAIPAPAANISWTGLLQSPALQLAESDSFTVSITDSAGAVASESFTVNVTAAPLNFNMSAQYGAQLDATDVRYWLQNDQYNEGAALATQFGYSHRLWRSYQPFPFALGTDKGFPSACRGWYPYMGFWTSLNGGDKTAPLSSTGIQIASLTQAMIRAVVSMPSDRTTFLGWQLFDCYIHSIPNPAATPVSGNTQLNTDPNNPILSVMIQHANCDTGDYTSTWMGTLDYTANPPVYTANRIMLGGQLWFYTLQNNYWAANPPLTGTYNTIRLVPGNWNDLQQSGCNYIYVDYAGVLKDLCAAAPALGLPITLSSYMSGVALGFEVNAGGPTIPTDQRFVDVYDFQVSMQNEAPPVINLCVEPSPIVSRSLPVASITSSTDLYAARLASSADYRYYWRTNQATPSAVAPNSLAFDISTLTAAQKSALLLHWSSQGGGVTGGTTTNFIGNQGYFLSTSYNVPGAYTIDGNVAGFSGGAAPASGWVTLSTVAQNWVIAGAVPYCRSGRTHLVNAQSYKSVRINITAPCATNAGYGSAGYNNATALHCDLAAAGTVSGAPFGIGIIGDSISNKVYKEGDTEEGGAAEYCGDILRHYLGFTPIVENMSTSFYTLSVGSSGAAVAYINYINGVYASIITDCPLRYIWLALGTNDAATGVTQTQFQTDLTTVANLCISLGKTLILPSVMYRPGANVGPLAFSGYIQNVIAALNSPQVIAGPDQNTYGANFQSLLWNAGDAIHPSPYGQSVIRGLNMDWFARVICLGQPASMWVANYSVGVGVGGH
jgi:hypothetical protein